MAYMKFVGKTDETKYKDDNSFADLINYIANPEKTISVGFANVASIETAAAEMQAIAMQGRKSSGKKICHFVITFSAEELKKHGIAMVEDVARQCMMYFAGRFQVVYSIHAYSHEHIHIIINRVSPVDFRRFLDRFEDRERFWRFLRQILYNYNICLWR